MNAIVTELLQSMDSKPNLVPAKVHIETMRWIKRERNRLYAAAGEKGKEPIVADILQRAVEDAVKHREGELTRGKSQKHPDLLIPSSVFAVIEMILDWYSKKGDPELEMLKGTLQLAAATRQADLKASKKEKASSTKLKTS